MSVCTGGRYGWVDRVVEKMEEKNRLNMVRVEFHEGKLRQGWGFGVFSEGSVTICRGTRQESYLSHNFRNFTIHANVGLLCFCCICVYENSCDSTPRQ